MSVVAGSLPPAHPHSLASSPIVQVEFYFSDSNLYRDEFLHDLITSSDDGYVDLATLCMFNRMKQLLNLSAQVAGDVSGDAVGTVVDALTSSTELTVSEDGTRVKRVRALEEDPTAIARAIDSRSVVAGPFRFDVTLEELQGYFETLGETKSVRMRRHVQSKDFRGSVFVEFASVEESERVLGKEKGSVVYDGAPIEMERKVEFLEKRAAERQAREQARGGRPDRGEGEDGKRRRFDDRDRGRDRDRNDNNEPPSPVAVKAVTDEDVVAEVGAGDTVVRFEFTLPEGEREKLQSVSFGLVKDSLGGREAGLVYVEYESAGIEGCARFNCGEAAKKAVERAEGGKLMIAGFEAAVTVLEGDAERAYVRKMLEAKAVSAAERATRERDSGRRPGRGRGRGGRNSGYHKRRKM